MHTSVRLQNKQLYLTYMDSQHRITGPGYLLNTLAEKLKSYNPYYGISCEEEAPSTGTRHFHLLILCRDTIRRRTGEILEIDGVAPHVETVHNNLKAIIDYIKKNGIIAELNKENCPVKNQIAKEEKREIMMNGDLKQAFMDGTIGAIDVVRAFKIRSIFQIYEKPTEFKKKLVLWFKGSSGEGKTRCAVDIAKTFNKQYWISNGDLKWFDGYAEQEIAIIDEFRKSMLSDWSYLLRLLDGYHMLVPIKGSYTKWTPEIVIITTPATPGEAFSWVSKDGQVQEWDRQEQLERRLTYEDELQVYEFPLWGDEKQRLFNTIRRFLGIEEEEQAMVEEEFELSPIMPEPSQNDEA